MNRPATRSDALYWFWTLWSLGYLALWAILAWWPKGTSAH